MSVGRTGLRLGEREAVDLRVRRDERQHDTTEWRFSASASGGRNAGCHSRAACRRRLAAFALVILTFGGASATFALAWGCRGLIWRTDAAEETELRPRKRMPRPDHEQAGQCDGSVNPKPLVHGSSIGSRRRFLDGSEQRKGAVAARLARACLIEGVNSRSGRCRRRGRSCGRGRRSASVFSMQ